MHTIKVQVRIEGVGSGNERSVAFWREGEKLCCFNWRDGHNTASDEYRLSLPMANFVEAAEFVELLQRYYDSLAEYVGDIHFQSVQRLSRQ